MKNKKGFTLIELLVVIGMITILFAIVLIAVNPARQFAQARNTQRRSDIRAILDACWQYAADHNGNPPSVITTTPTNIGTGTGKIDLTADLTPTYITAIPKDPDGGTDADTLYAISKNANNRITVSATNAELGETISVTR